MSTHPPRPIVVLVLAATLASLGACRGHFSNRKEETASGTIAVPAGTKRVRFVVPPGGLSVEAGTKPGIIAYSAQLKRAADDAAPEPVAPAAEPAAEAPQALVPAPTEVAPCQALPVGAAPLSGPPATPAPATAIQPQKAKANGEEFAPRRERKTEARRDAEALRGVSSEPDYGI